MAIKKGALNTQDFEVSQFVRLRDFIYMKTGIFFEEKKLYLVKKRVNEHMSLLEMADFDTYYRFLKFRDDGTEFQRLINLLTTNETYFFREFDQLAVFAEECLYEVCARKEEAGIKRLRIWSAGCSTGEEPYTLAIILLEMIDDIDDWDVKIEATDIDTKVLERARHGVYGKRSVRLVPEEYFQKYFKTVSGNYRIDDRVRSIVRFSHLNLMDERKMRSIKGVDFIFCRNVLIYFDERSRKEVVARFYDAMNPGGYIFLGHSESLSRITTAFNVKKINSFIVYQKPLTAEKSGR